MLLGSIAGSRGLGNCKKLQRSVSALTAKGSYVLLCTNIVTHENRNDSPQETGICRWHPSPITEDKLINSQMTNLFQGSVKAYGANKI